MNRARREGQADSFYASVNDLMVGVLFIFIILLVAAGVTYRQQSQRLQDRVEQQLQARERLLTQVAKRAKLEVDPERFRRGIIRLPSETLFASNEAALRSGGDAVLRRLAEALGHYLPCYTGGRSAGCPNGGEPLLDALYIEGHTDSETAVRPWASNWELSSARAVTVYRTLVRHQPRLERLRNADARERVPLLGISAYAASRPIVRRADADVNRRVDLRFTLVQAEAT